MWALLLAACATSSPYERLHDEATPEELRSLLVLPPEMIDAMPEGVVLTGEPLTVGLAWHGVADAALACPACGCAPALLGPLVQRAGQLWPRGSLNTLTQRLSVLPRPPDGTVYVERAIHVPTPSLLALQWPSAWTLSVTVQGDPVEPLRRGDVVWLPPGEDIVMEGGGAAGPGQRVDVDAVSLDVSAWFGELPGSMGVALQPVPGMSPFLPSIQQVTAGRALLVAYRRPAVKGRDGVRVALSLSDPEPLLEELLRLRDDLPGFPRPLFVYEGAVDVAAGDAWMLSEASRAGGPPTEAAIVRLWLDAVDPELRAAVVAWWMGQPDATPAPSTCGSSASPTPRLRALEEEKGRGALLEALGALRAQPGASWPELVKQLGAR